MDAIILAAGLGSRLGALSRGRPKGLIEIGGRPLLHHILAILSRHAFAQVIVVTGGHDAVLRQSLGHSYGQLHINYVHNAEFDQSGSMVSLAVAAPHIRAEECAVFESDLLFHPGFIETLLTACPENGLLTADATGSGDEVWIEADESGHLTFLGKSASPQVQAAAVGEFAGISRVTKGFLEKYCEIASRYEKTGQGQQHYEQVFFEMAMAGTPFYVRHCPGLAWTEIDTPADLKRAREEVWPRLAGVV